MVKTYNQYSITKKTINPGFFTRLKSYWIVKRSRGSYFDFKKEESDLELKKSILDFIEKHRDVFESLANK